jgi:transposase
MTPPASSARAMSVPLPGLRPSMDYDGHISRQSDGELRTALYEAASGLMTRSKIWCTLKACEMKLQRHRGHKPALMAVARKLAPILHAMWRDGSEFWFRAGARTAARRPV